MIDNTINHIKDMLSQRHRDRASIMKDAINERLDKSLQTYSDTLDSSVKYISQKSELNVLKKL